MPPQMFSIPMTVLKAQSWRPVNSRRTKEIVETPWRMPKTSSDRRRSHFVISAPPTMPPRMVAAMPKPLKIVPNSVRENPICWRM